MAPVYVFAITATVLILLGRLPGTIGELVGRHQMTLGLAIPLAAFFGPHYLIFAISIVALVVAAPALSWKGLSLPAADAVELRSRLFMFCLPLMATLAYTVGIGGVTLVRLTYMNILAAAFLWCLLRANVVLLRRELLPWDALFVLMLAVQTFMDARGHYPVAAFRLFNQMIVDLGLIYLVTSRAFFTSRTPARLMLSLLIGACLVAAVSVFETNRSWLLYDTIAGGLGADPEAMSGYTKLRGGLLRGQATFDESTGLSLFLAICTVLAVALRGRFAAYVAFAVVAGLLAAGLFFTLARIGYIVVAVGVVACILHERRWIMVLVTVALLAAARVGMYAAARYSPALAASLGTAEDAAGSVDYRAQLLRSGLALVREHWVSGRPLKDVYAELEHLRQGEGIVDLVNQPLTILMRAGLVGASMYYALLGAVLVALFLRARAMDEEHRAVACGCFAALIAIMVGLTTTSYGRNEISFVLLLAASGAMLARVRAGRTRRTAHVQELPTGSRAVEREPALG